MQYNSVAVFRFNPDRIHTRLHLQRIERIHTGIHYIRQQIHHIAAGMQLRYDAGKLFSTLDAVGEEGKRLMLRFWFVDLALICGMFAMMATVTNNVAKIGWIAAVMLWSNIVRAVADFAEDLLLITAAAGYPAKKRAIPANIAGVITMIKWAAAVLWVAGMFLSLFIRGWAM